MRVPEGACPQRGHPYGKTLGFGRHPPHNPLAQGSRSSSAGGCRKGCGWDLCVRAGQPDPSSNEAAVQHRGN